MRSQCGKHVPLTRPVNSTRCWQRGTCVRSSSRSSTWALVSGRVRGARPRSGRQPTADARLLFAAARSAGRVHELDRLCQARALQTALDAGVAAPFGLFVNVEPAAVSGIEPPTALLAALRERGIGLVIELTERALTDDPARLLALADWARAAGWGVALDDVGADPDSLALMPFLRPDVVKLNLHLVQQRPDQAVAEIMTAVTAYAEQSGAHILAEGIETAEHEQMARSLGATLGQGWRFGRPAPLPADSAARPVPRRPLVLPGADERPVSRSPYAAAALRTPQRGAKSLLVAVSKLLERQAGELHGLAVVLAPLNKPGSSPPPRPSATPLWRTRRRSSSRSAPACRPNRYLVYAALICKPMTRCSVSGTSPWSARTSPPPWSPAT